MNLCRINKSRSRIRRAGVAIAVSADASSVLPACSALRSDKAILSCRAWPKNHVSRLPHPIRARFSQRIPAQCQR